MVLVELCPGAQPLTTSVASCSKPEAFRGGYVLPPVLAPKLVKKKKQPPHPSCPSALPDQLIGLSGRGNYSEGWFLLLALPRRTGRLANAPSAGHFPRGPGLGPAPAPVTARQTSFWWPEEGSCRWPYKTQNSANCFSWWDFRGMEAAGQGRGQPGERREKEERSSSRHPCCALHLPPSFLPPFSTYKNTRQNILPVC